MWSEVASLLFLFSFLFLPFSPYTLGEIGLVMLGNQGDDAHVP